MKVTRNRCKPKGKTNGHKTSPRMVRIILKELKALKARTEGKTYSVIADEVGYASRGAAYNAVMSGLDRTVAEPTEKMRKIELTRLDGLHAAYWILAIKGDIEAAKFVLKIQDRRARLMGLDIQGSDEKPEVHRFIVEVSEMNGNNGGDPTPGQA